MCKCVRQSQALAGALAPRGVQLGLAAMDYRFDAAHWPPESLQAFGSTLVTLEASISSVMFQR